MPEISHARFNEIDAASPEVWRYFTQFTQELISRGFRHHSADAVLHRVRWQTAQPQNDPSNLQSYKICNDWSAFYARKFHKLFPQHAGFFRTRPSIADTPADILLRERLRHPKGPHAALATPSLW